MKILLTRTAENNQRTSDRLLQLGFEPICLALGQLKDLGATPNLPAENYIITSSAVFDVLMIRESSDHNNIDLFTPIYCVGERTAEAAKQFGFNNIKSTAENALVLSKHIISEFGQSPALMTYLAGKERAFDFSKQFAGIDVEVETHEIYEIERLKPSKENFLKALQSARNGVQFHYSALSARYFFSLVEEYGAQELCKSMDSISISQFTSQAVDISLVKSAQNAKIASEASMLRQLEYLKK